MAAGKVPVLLNLVAASYSVSIKAGQIVRDIMSKGDLGIIDKGKNDLQTEADRSAQYCIVASLSKRFPKVTIIGEEGVQSKRDIPDEWIVSETNDTIIKQKCPSELATLKEEDITVWVDPLDGTAEFTQGHVDHVTVLIGIAVGDNPVAGVIHQPFANDKGILGRTIWGVKGIGIGGFDASPPPQDKFIITTTRSHSNELVESAIRILKPTEVLRVGGAGYKVLLLLEGKAHAYVFPTPGSKRWDTCAPEAILNSVGGILTDTAGNKYSYDRNTEHMNKGGVLAAYTDKYHAMCLSALNSSK